MWFDPSKTAYSAHGHNTPCSIFITDLNISEYVNLLALTPELTMTAITGFAHETGTEDEFKAYLQKLEEITKQEMEKTQNKNNYDTARGNPGR